ncbi:MAG: arginyltransferase [Planctomycetota bacterium]
MTRDPNPSLDTIAPTPDGQLVVLYDAIQECPYLQGQIARMPLEHPRTPLSHDDLDRLLERGYRRTGTMFYRTHCPSCRECIPTRVDVTEFQPTRSMRRVLHRANRELEIEFREPRADHERVRLFNEHRLARRLSSDVAGTSDYRDFLVSSCVETVELSFFKDGSLIGVAIVDVGKSSINAVYTCFAESAHRYSIGTLAILKQIEFAQASHRRYVYLGLFVADNAHLNYKARFLPQQRLLDGEWRTIAP